MPTARPTRGYTLIELLIVLVILGILAAVVLPRLGDIQAGSKDVILASDLSLIRNAIEHYKVTHEGNHPDTDPAAQLTLRTDRAGVLLAQTSESVDALPAGASSMDVRQETSASPVVATAPIVGLGPFLRPPFPANPVNELTTIMVVDRLPEQADGSTGWIYVRNTGVIRANLPQLGIGKPGPGPPARNGAASPALAFVFWVSMPRHPAASGTIFLVLSVLSSGTVAEPARTLLTLAKFDAFCDLVSNLKPHCTQQVCWN